MVGEGPKGPHLLGVYLLLREGTSLVCVVAFLLAFQVRAAVFYQSKSFLRRCRAGQISLSSIIMGVVEKVRQNCPCYHTYLCYVDQGDRGWVRSYSPILFVHSSIAAFQRRWRGVRGSKLFVAYTTNTAQQRRRTRWIERRVLLKRLKFLFA
jgi:hypothetical protein